METDRKCLAAVRIRGPTDVKGEVEETLKILRLNQSCHAVLLDDRPPYVGMLKKAENQIAWGEVSKETVSLLVKKWGRTNGNKKLTEEYAKKVGYNSLDDLIEAAWKLQVNYKDIPEIKPVFRLHPPRKGFKGGVKKSYVSGGSLGYMGEAINDLLKRMA